MVSQTVLKTAGDKTLAGSTPVPSVTIFFDWTKEWKRLLDDWKLCLIFGSVDPEDKRKRENANGKQDRC